MKLRCTGALELVVIKTGVVGDVVVEGSLNIHADLRDAVAIKVWSGHARASLLTDLYSHVLLDHRDEWQGFWRAAYAAERSGGVVSVWSRETENTMDPAT